MEAPSYNWECQVCGASNLAGVGSCAKCKFPAVANGRAIAAAKKVLFPEAADLKPRAAGLLQPISTFLSAPLPVWRKVVGIAGLAGFLGGILLFQGALSLFQFMLGGLIVAISLLVLKAVLGGGQASTGVGG